jgi:hypothetical protein
MREWRITSSSSGEVTTVENWIELARHPSTPAEAVRAITVLLRRSANELRMTFRLDGDIRRISIPSPSAPRIARQLWQHTCFEAFVAVEGQREYHEFNFAPSGEWAAYAFSGYRNGPLVPLASDMLRPDIAVRSTDNRLELDSVVRLDALSAIHPHAPIRVALAAVVEASDAFSYWALRHPADKPDFHDADGFALLLEPSASE